MSQNTIIIFNSNQLQTVCMSDFDYPNCSLGYTTVYLTTHDKQDFYAHVGYTYCDPVVSLGSASSLLSSDQVSYF